VPLENDAPQAVRPLDTSDTVEDERPNATRSQCAL